MAKRRKSRKYRRGRFVPLLRILFFLLVCVALAVAMTIFFKVEKITVSGNSRYTSDEIIDATGIRMGENMFMMNKYDVISRLARDLPYIKTVQIRRRLPSTMTVEITEMQAVAAVQSAEFWWLIGADGKLLEKTDSSGNLPRVTGTNPLLPTAGSKLSYPEEGTITDQELLDLLAILEQKGMEKIIVEINCGDPELLVLRYGNRFRVEMKYDADMNRKLNMLVEVVARLEENETGTIRMTREDGTCHFIPGTLDS